jgi:hypothetical protein
LDNSRIGAKTVKQVPLNVLAGLNGGTLASCNLMEILAVDFTVLFKTVVPNAAPTIHAALSTVQSFGIVQRMQLAGTLLLQHCTTHLQPLTPFTQHTSDIVRGWAWMAFRPYVLTDIPNALNYLQPWAEDKQPNIRRFACEVTRPRGVWCKHSSILQQTPWLATNTNSKFK